MKKEQKKANEGKNDHPANNRDEFEKIDPDKMTKNEYLKVLKVKSRKNLLVNLKNNLQAQKHR